MGAGDALRGRNQGLELISRLQVWWRDGGKLWPSPFPLDLDAVASSERSVWRFNKHDFARRR